MITKVSIYHEPKRKRPWLVRWWERPNEDTGKQTKRSRSFQYRRDAVTFQIEQQADVNSQPNSLPSANASLGHLIAEFRKSRLARLSHSSKQGYNYTIEQLTAFFGAKRPVRSIEQRQAEAFISSRKRRDGRSGDLSSWTLAQYLKYCRAIFGAATDWGYTTRNPFLPPKKRGHSVLRVKPRSKPWQHITPADFRQLLAVIKDPHRRATLWLMYACGLRPGEVYNLTIDCIDLCSRRLYVKNRPASRDRPPFSVKAQERSADGKERRVSIPAAAVRDIQDACRLALRSGGFVVLTPERHAYVREAWRRCQEGQPWGHHQAHRPWQNCDMVNNALRSIKASARKAGLQLTAPLTLTTFRKSYAQNHADNGTPPRTLARLLGHSDV